MKHAVIMAGGSGTRLWPLSRQGMPKQLLPLIDGRSLLQLAHARAATVVDPSRVWVCAGLDCRDLILDQLPGLNPDNLLSEPVGRDSFAAVAWSTATIAAQDPEAVVAVMSADHVISPQSAFSSALSVAFDAAETDAQALVTLAVAPTSAHVGFGYLQVGEEVGQSGLVFRVLRFAEKPTAELARLYVEQGCWWWNSGMFVWRASTFLHQAGALKPETMKAVTALVEQPDLIGGIYPELERISVDYAIMEPVSQGLTDAHVLTVRLDAQWADVGGFGALLPYMAPVEGNAIAGEVVTFNSSGNLILNQTRDGRIIAVSGLRDIAVVQVDDITMVCPLAQAETVKELARLAQERDRRYA